MTMLEHDRYTNGTTYARTYAKRWGAPALYIELGRLLNAQHEHPRFVEGFADESIRVACEAEARERAAAAGAVA
jgi:hypothetical protein